MGIVKGRNEITLPLKEMGVVTAANLATCLDGSGPTVCTGGRKQLGAGAISDVATYAKRHYDHSSSQSLGPTQGVVVQSSKAGIWLPEGTPYTSPPIISLQHGWNFVSTPYPPGGLSTTTIDAEAAGCNVREIKVYENGTYQRWTRDQAPLMVPTYRPVWIDCTGSGQWTPGGG